MESKKKKHSNIREEMIALCHWSVLTSKSKLPWFWLLTLSFQFLLSQACGSIKGYLDGRNSFCFSRHCYFVELNTESRVPAAIIWHKYHISSMLTSIDIDFLTALFMICYYWSTDNHKRLNLLKSLMAWSQFWAERTGRGWFSED